MPQKSKCCILSTLNQVFILFLRISPGDAGAAAAASCLILQLSSLSDIFQDGNQHIKFSVLTD